jgi:hypothetical protein
MLGKKISEYLFNTLYNKAKNEIIIVLDSDAYDDAEKLFNKLNGGKLSDRIWLIKLEGAKDVADLCGNLNNQEKIKLF